MDNARTKPRYKQFFAIDETVGLHKNYSFRLAIFLPLVVSAIFIIIFLIQLTIDGQFRLSISQPDVTAFIKYFTFPISLLSLSIVFGVMVARFHSSKQKAKSNDITLRNNSVNYFYKTHEEFDKFCVKLIAFNDFGFKKLRSDLCYSILFKESTPESPSLKVSDDFFKMLSKIMRVYIEGYVDYLDSDEYESVLVSPDGKVPHYFSRSAVDLLSKRLGIELEGFACVYELSQFDENYYLLYNSICQLLCFPGIEDRGESFEQLNLIYRDYYSVLNNSPKYIQWKKDNHPNYLQTPQS